MAKYSHMDFKGLGLWMSIFRCRANKEIQDYAAAHEGDKFAVEIDALGMITSDDARMVACALRVSKATCLRDNTECPSTSKVKRIDIINTQAHTKDITDWATLSHPFTLAGTLRVFTM